MGAFFFFFFFFKSVLETGRRSGNWSRAVEKNNHEGATVKVRGVLGQVRLVG
jgi:hypothetical protein